MHLERTSAWKHPTTTLLVGTRLRVWVENDRSWHTGSVVERTALGHRVLFDNGDQDDLDLSEEQFSLLSSDSSGSSAPLWARNMEAYWIGRLGDTPAARAVIAVMERAIGDNTRGNYHPKSLEYLQVCASASPPLVPVPADPNTIMHYLGYIKAKGTISAASVGVYLSSVNKLHTESGFARPAIGAEIRDFIRGMGRIQREALVESGDLSSVRAPLPTHIVTEALDLAARLSLDCESLSREQACLLRSCTFVALNFVLICRGETGVTLSPSHLILDESGIHVVPTKEKGRGHIANLRLVSIPRDAVSGLYDLLVRYKLWHSTLHFVKKRQKGYPIWQLPHEVKGRWMSSRADDFLQHVLRHLGHTAPAGLSFLGHSMRGGSSSAAKSIGCQLENICHFAGWSILAGTYHTYIDPTWVATRHCWRLFAWMRPSDRPPAD